MNSEARLIAALCKNKDMYVALNEGLDEVFTTHGDVWEYVKEHHQRYSSVPDIGVVQEKFRDLEDYQPKSETKFYVDELKEEYARNLLESMLLGATKSIKQGVPSRHILEDLYGDVSRLTRITSVVKDIDIAKEWASRLDHMRELSEMNEDGFLMGGGIATGIAPIDVEFGGFRGGDFIVIMGWTGSMKSWLSSLLACRAWEQGKKVMFVSLEMSPPEVAARVDTIMAAGEFSNRDLLSGAIEFDQFEAWAKKKYDDRGGLIVVSNEGIDEITVETVQAKVEQHRPDLVICDYHQLFDDARRGKSETERNKNISKDFKKLAMRNNIPVIDITAVTMEDGSQGKRPPLLEEVAWSKQIAYDANLCLAVNTDKVKPDTQIMEVVTRKTRRGHEFDFYLRWNVDRGEVAKVEFDAD